MPPPHGSGAPAANNPGKHKPSRRRRRNGQVISDEDPDRVATGEAGNMVGGESSRRDDDVEDTGHGYVLDEVGLEVHRGDFTAAEPSGEVADFSDDSGGSPGPSDRAEATTSTAVGCDHVVRAFSGHRNAATVKGVAFMGLNDEYVVSGSDDGHVYIWSKATGTLYAWLEGDREVVNCLEPHPWLPCTLATSGIEHDVKIWAPTLPERQRVPAEANRVMEANMASRARRSESLFITPAMLRMLFVQRGARERRGATAVHTRPAAAMDDDDANDEDDDNDDSGDTLDEDYTDHDAGVHVGRLGRVRRRPAAGNAANVNGEHEAEDDDDVDDDAACYIS
eukprot:jgi/Chrzof1/3553/Cz13g00050.t1